MFRESIGVDAADLDWSVIERLVADHTPESQYLDFKQEVSRTGSGPKDFAVDIAAMANGGGGVIIVGIVDKNDRAAGIQHFALVGAQSWFETVVNGNVQPHPRVESRPIVDPQRPGEGVIAFAVYPSERAPFAVSDTAARFIWKTRVGQHNQPLSEADIERMYRERFARRERVDTRLSSLIGSGAPERQRTAELGRLLIAIVPTVSVSRRFRINRELIREADGFHRKARHVHSTNWWGQPIPHYSRPILRGVEWTWVRDESEDGRRIRPILQLFDDGAFLAMTPGYRQRIDNIPISGGVDQGTVFNDATLVIGVLSQLSAFAWLSRRFNIVGDFACSVALVQAAEPLIVSTEFEVHFEHEHRRVNDQISTALSFGSGDIMTGGGMISVAKFILDDLFSALGWPGCPRLGDDGTLRERFFDRRDVDAMSPWAQYHGISWSQMTE